MEICSPRQNAFPLPDPPTHQHDQVFRLLPPLKVFAVRTDSGNGPRRTGRMRRMKSEMWARRASWEVPSRLWDHLLLHSVGTKEPFFSQTNLISKNYQRSKSRTQPTDIGFVEFCRLPDSFVHWIKVIRRSALRDRRG